MDKYHLYHNDYSLYSLQVRYTLALAGKPREGLAPMQIELTDVDLFNSGQLAEFFLTNINPKGQAGGFRPCKCTFRGTRAISENELLKAVHALNYFALSFPDRPQVATSFVKNIQDWLARDDISDEYRKALEYKLSVTTQMKVHGIQPDAVRANEQKARELMGRLEALLSSSSSSSSEKGEGQGPWLFGLEQPTALDAHVVILIGRLQDVGRTSVVSERLLEYTDAAFQTPKLQTVMAGRRTMAPMQ
ncbi:hypothetical protein LTR92_000830 [Exophiala xenobiotica]|nr:hypothetical protein LTR92_000830 [Exophiala xenobiotica]KAK5553780.1 hypothetical protein LTR46_008326 [Exophiala xenobiotica]